MDRKSIIVVIAIIVLATAYYWWTLNGKHPVFFSGTSAISEPPIAEQINTQLASLKTKNAVPLPIPITIGKSTVTTLDMATLESTLKMEGFVATGKSENTLNEGGETGLGDYYQFYLHKQSGNYANVLFVKSDHGSGGWFNATINEKSYFPTPESTRDIKPTNTGVVGIDFLKLGMTELQVRKALAHTPHDTMADAFHVKARTGKIPGISLEMAESITGAMAMTKEEGIHLARGMYFYTLQFQNGVLCRIIVEDTSQILNSAGMSVETYQLVLASIFDV